MTEEQRQSQNFRRTIISLGIWVSAAVLLLALCAVTVALEGQSRAPLGDAFAIFCHGGSLGLAFASIGGLIGFLFGIPRSDSFSSEQATPQEGSSQAAGGTATSAATQSVNTNLEQVSDWLTKIILGAGLTQLIKVPEKIRTLGDSMAGDFGNNHLIPEMITLHSLILGFFIGYLITRLFLASAFAIADSDTALAKVSRIMRLADAQTEKRNFADASATLEAAIDHISPDAPRDTKLLYYERLSYTALYEAPPQGFQKSIDYVNRFVKEEGAPSARLLVNLACAYGQQYAWEAQNQKRDDVLSLSRKQALDAVKQAIQLDPGTKTILRNVWRPGEAQVREAENDLESFKDDPDFTAVLGS